MIDVQLAGSLLDVAAEDPVMKNRLIAIKTLTFLPLAPATWRAVAAVGASTLRDLEEATGLDGDALAVLARIPVRSMRERLGQIACDTTHPASLNSALALARHGDAAGLHRLLLELKTSARIAETLACLPIERLGVTKKPFNNCLKRRDPMLGFWAAIALARLGEFGPLEQLWNTLVFEQGDFEEVARPLLMGKPHRFFPANYFSFYKRLERARPLPEHMQRYLAELYENEETEGSIPRDAKLFVEALTDSPDVHGTPTSGESAATGKPPLRADALRADEVAERLLRAPYRDLRLNVEGGDIAILSALSPDRAGELLSAGLHALARSPIGEGNLPEDIDDVAINNAVLDLATALPRDLKLSLDTLVDDNEVASRIPRDALCWALARVGPNQLAEQVGLRIQSAPSAERETVLSWARDIAASLNAPAPYKGAGPEPDEPPLLAGVIDDTGQNAGPLPPEGRPAKTEPEKRTLFPDIKFSDDHPVSQSPLKVEVALSVQAVPGVGGEVTLPVSAPDMVHILDVHLLVGNDSQWDTLEFSEAEGTRKKASFDVRTPTVASGDDRALAEVRANFYLNKRWCGEGLRNLDVRRVASVPPLATVPVPDEPEWRKLLNLEPGAQPPDLIVRIQKKTSVGEYVWSCLSPHVFLPAPATPQDSDMALGSDAETYVRTLFKPLAAKKTLERDDIADLRGVGENIYQATPRVFKDAYWTVWKAAQAGGFKFESVQIITDEPCVPWELMRVSDEARAPDVPPEFLAIRHCVGRWLALESTRLVQKITVTKLAVSASDYSTVTNMAQKLPWAAKEKEFLQKNYTAQGVDLKSAALLDFLEAGGAQTLHLACHGQMSVMEPNTSKLILEDDPKNLKPTMVNTTEVRRGLGRDHPLVFLNACDVGGVAASLSLVAGFPAAFLGAGAAAVISPLWAVHDERAKEIAEFFYTHAFGPSPRTIGDIMREIRAGWTEKQHLTYLAYVLYGDPLARVHYTPAN